jgi:GH15 family glucan-1,4-alpha-glucosidase
VTLPEGAHHDLMLELSDTAMNPDPPDADRLWKGTVTAWRQAMPNFGASIATRDTRHSYAVLRGLTSSGGGMVAAATMGLPERAEKGRNYDYRYVWIRDQCYAGQAVAADGPHPLLDDAVTFVSERIVSDGPNLKPAYTIAGGRVPHQRSLDLPGYPGGNGILGNHVNAQFQLDALGEALLLFAAAARHDHLGTDHYRAVTAAVGAIEARWREPGAGVWELDNHRWAHSRLICAAGLRAIAAAGASAADAVGWSWLADTIVADAASDCVHPTGRWQRAPGDARVDAALLLPAIRGALPATDPRSVATVQAVRAELGEDSYVYRFRHDDRPLGEAEGAFTLCGFLMALADHQQGDRLAARIWFERNRAACGPPGLFSEEYDVTQRQLRGNLPQAFVHALMLEAAVRLT